MTRTLGILFRPLQLAALAALAVAFSPAPAFGQDEETGYIQGRIRNLTSDRALNNVRVSIVGTNRQTQTDQYGEYRFTNVPPGSVTIETYYTGMTDQSKTVDVTPGGMLFVNFDLTPAGGVAGEDEVYVLDGIEVVAQQLGGDMIAVQEQRFSANLKSVTDAEAFGKVGEGNVGEFVKALPGVNINYDGATAQSIQLRGFDSNFTPVNVDGNRMASAASSTANREFELEQVSLNNVQRIEVNKTFTPDQWAEGLGGSVNIVSKNAFERSESEFKFTTSINLNSENLNLSKSYGPGDSETFRWRPAADFSWTDPVSSVFGYSVSGSYSDRYNNRKRSIMEWRGNGNLGQIQPGTGQLAPAYVWPGEYTFLDGPEEQERMASKVNFDWKIAQSTTLSFGFEHNRYNGFFNNNEMHLRTGTGGSGMAEAEKADSEYYTINVPLPEDGIVPSVPVTVFSPGNFWDWDPATSQYVKSDNPADSKGIYCYNEGSQYGMETSHQNKSGSTNHANLTLRHFGTKWTIDGDLYYSKSTNEMRDTEEGHFDNLDCNSSRPGNRRHTDNAMSWPSASLATPPDYIYSTRHSVEFYADHATVLVPDPNFNLPVYPMFNNSQTELAQYYQEKFPWLDFFGTDPSKPDAAVVFDVFDPRDPRNLRLRFAESNPTHTTDTWMGGKINVKRDFETAIPFSLQAGIAYRQQTRDNVEFGTRFSINTPEGKYDEDAATPDTQVNSDRYLNYDANGNIIYYYPKQADVQPTGSDGYPDIGNFIGNYSSDAGWGLGTQYWVSPYMAYQVFTDWFNRKGINYPDANNVLQERTWVKTAASAFLNQPLPNMQADDPWAGAISIVRRLGLNGTELVSSSGALNIKNVWLAGKTINQFGPWLFDFGGVNDQGVPGEIYDLFENDYKLTESVKAAYVQGTMKFFNNKLSILAGVRFEKTEDEGWGFTYDGNAYQRLYQNDMDRLYEYGAPFMDELRTYCTNMAAQCRAEAEILTGAERSGKLYKAGMYDIYAAADNIPIPYSLTTTTLAKSNGGSAIRRFTQAQLDAYIDDWRGDYIDDRITNGMTPDDNRNLLFQQIGTVYDKFGNIIGYVTQTTTEDAPYVSTNTNANKTWQGGWMVSPQLYAMDQEGRMTTSAAAAFVFPDGTKSLGSMTANVTYYVSNTNSVVTPFANEAKLDGEGNPVIYTGTVLNESWRATEPHKYLAGYMRRSSHVTKTYDGFFPALNASLSITDNLVIRAGYGQVQGRPNFSLILPRLEVYGDTAYGPGESYQLVEVNNTGLQPWISDNYDLSIEYYPTTGGQISAGLFIKNVTGIFLYYDEAITYADDEWRSTFTKLGINPALAGGACITTVLNSKDVLRVSGVELNWQQPLRQNFLPSWMRFFTLTANATFLDYNTEGLESADLSSFIKKTMNFSMDFDKKPWRVNFRCNIRGAQQQREIQDYSDNFLYLDAYGNKLRYEAVDILQEQITYDLNVEYRINKNLSFFISGRNIFGDKPCIKRISTLSEIATFMQEYRLEDYGSTYTVGIKGLY